MASDRYTCDDPTCVVCVAAPSQHKPTGVEQVLASVPGDCSCPHGMVCGRIGCQRSWRPPFGGPRRDPFPSLSLMSKPITPAPPRLRFFPDCDLRLGNGKWRCRVEIADIARHRRITTAGLSVAHYAATGPEGWGNTKERAYEAWKSKWRACMEAKYQP